MGRYDVPGTGMGQLKGPCGVAVDMFGFILVAEHGNCRVSIFNKHGVFIRSFGTSAQFSELHEIVISPTGDICICDTGNKQIQMFSTQL